VTKKQKKTMKAGN